MPFQRRIRNGVQPEQVRAKIRGAYLIRRLQQHVAGKIKLTAEQVRSADILLRKIIPDLSQSSVSGEMTHKYVVEVPPLLTKDEWLKRYRVPAKTAIEHKPERPTPPTIDATPMLPLPPPTKQ
jgi:hypothetical protein